MFVGLVKRVLETLDLGSVRIADVSEERLRTPTFGSTMTRTRYANASTP
ncbi:hypothetical protein ACIRL2_43855 [Embleya sp. NPDC127516]